MLSLFKARCHVDPELGALTRSRGAWRGSLRIDGVTVPLSLCGPRSMPSDEALSLAKSAQAQLASCRAAIEAELFSHHLGYADAIASGEFEPASPLAALESPSAVWAHLSPVFVAVAPLDGTLSIELGYTAAWDEEHILGVRLQRGTFVELCGSTLPP